MKDLIIPGAAQVIWLVKSFVCVCVIFNLELRLKLNYNPINIALHTPFIVSINKDAKEFPAGRHSQFLPCF